MTDLIIREPKQSEVTRVVYLFRNGILRAQARILVAVRTRPVERFVAAVAWWPEGTLARFHLVSQPGVPVAAYQPLLDGMLASVREAGIQRIHYADVLSEEAVTSSYLKSNGFAPLGKNRFFEASYENAWIRVTQMLEKCRPDIPPDWRTESIRNHRPELVLDLIGNHRLLPAAELQYYWQLNSPGGMDLDASSILFSGTHPVGTMLARGGQETYYIDVRVIRVENRRLRALGNLLLFAHMADWQRPGGPISRLQFHGGEAEHRETANLAIRMGGRELPPRHIYAKEL